MLFFVNGMVGWKISAQDKVIATVIPWVCISQSMNIEHLLRYIRQELTSTIASTVREYITFRLQACYNGVIYIIFCACIVQSSIRSLALGVLKSNQIHEYFWVPQSWIVCMDLAYNLHYQRTCAVPQTYIYSPYNRLVRWDPKEYHVPQARKILRWLILVK